MRSDLLKFRGWSLAILIVLALALTACGGAASTEEENAPPEAGDVTAEEETTAEAETAAEEAETAAESEEAAEQEAATETEESDGAEEEAATEDENLLDPSASTSEAAECVPVDIPENPLIAEVSEADWSLGPADAPLTVIEYGDFQ